jgi:hypothetical protein
MIATAAMKLTEPVMTCVLRAIGEGGTERRLQEGLIEIPHFSPEHTYCVLDNWDVDDIDGELYGVSDTAQQALDYAQRLVGDDPRKFCVFVTHIVKDPSKRGRGGGWRWHKWGEYIGNDEPKAEYLDDEEGFDEGVYVFGIHPLVERSEGRDG